MSAHAVPNRSPGGRKVVNVLFNDALNTFYLRLYGIRHMVKDHSDSEKRKDITPVDQSTDWTSRMVVATKKSGDLRICLAPRPLNKALKHEHYPLPVMD